MLEELKRKDKIYDNKVEITHQIENYENLIFRELSRNLKGIGYEKAYNLYESLTKENLSFPLKSVQEGVSETTPDFLLVENKLITNEKTKFQNFFKELKNELRTCKSFKFTVSFIRHSGLQLIIKELKNLEEKGVEGEIITSTYLNITEPKALYKLLDFKNLKIKLYKGNNESFHTKAYIFHRENELGTVIVGSSNISQEALCNGREWNLRLSQSLEPDIFEKSNIEFYKIWNSNETIELTRDLVKQYERFYQKNKTSNFENFLDEVIDSNVIKPNKLQEEILGNLKKMRLDNKDKAIVIAATGTGKTFLSAFDVREFKADKILFLAHREELLDNGIDTYKKLFPNKSFGKISQNQKDFEAEFIFATVQSLSKDKFLGQFGKTQFDYIVIDEFHHAAADSYKGILSYFEPKFLLGLTATPERMDGKDIMSLCDYNIAGEIRLKEALEYELLAPFHYFGISDEVIDYTNIRKKNGRFDENDLSEKLSVNERVEFIIEKIKLYDYNGEKLKAIGFCVDIKHAVKMSNDFNNKGYRTAYITAKDSIEKRKNILDSFRNNNLEIIFTVDIFNEGIDIPEINMLLFLRPTESSTIFTQQLGRGLRKIKGKEYVTVLDFIGNYNKEFMLSKLFMKRENKNDVLSLKNEVLQEFNNMPNSVFVELDRICQRRVLDNLEKIKINSSSYLLGQYEILKKSIGQIPTILDFLYSDLDLTLIIKTFDSYAKFLSKVEKINLGFSEIQLEFIKNLEKKLSIKWWYEYLLLDLLLDKDEISIKELLKNGEKYFDTDFREEFHKELINNLINELGEKFISFDENFKLSEIFIGCLDENFYNYVKELIKYGLLRYKSEMKVEEFRDFPLVKYKEYSRVELQYLLQSSAEKGSWRAGYSIAKDNICLFITLNKDESTKEHLMYDNFFKGQNLVQWISQNKTSHESPIGQLYKFHKEKGYKVHVFIRKYSVFLGSAMDFTYLGEANYYESYGDKPMFILWELENKIPDELYVDLIG